MTDDIPTFKERRKLLPFVAQHLHLSGFSLILTISNSEPKRFVLLRDCQVAFHNISILIKLLSSKSIKGFSVFLTVAIRKQKDVLYSAIVKFVMFLHIK